MINISYIIPAPQDGEVEVPLGIQTLTTQLYPIHSSDTTTVVTSVGIDGGVAPQHEVTNIAYAFEMVMRDVLVANTALDTEDIGMAAVNAFPLVEVASTVTLEPTVDVETIGIAAINMFPLIENTNIVTLEPVVDSDNIGISIVNVFFELN